MNLKLLKTICIYAVDIVVILSMALSLSTVVQAAPISSFIGRWYAVDRDGSDIRLSIGSGIDGTFIITWTESYISACDGGPGVVRGVGWLNEEDPNLLEADLHLQCFTNDFTLDFHQVWRFHPDTNKLSSIWDGFITIWHRPTRRPVPLPSLDLRVNYGDNWVESFYEAGHTVWVTVTESDGATVKATAELFTEPRVEWGGEPGFQTYDSVWYDAAGTNMDYPPDIKPYDWVYGWVDNGANAMVQIGDIVGVVDLTSDSVAGTILAPWFDSQVDVECFPWGSPDPETPMKFDSVYPDGTDPYYCTWADEWDIQSGEPVGVGYFGPDGHWVANVFRNPRFTVFPEYEFIDAWEWLDGVPVTATVTGKPECEAVGVPGYPADNPWSTFAGIAFPEGCNVIAGDEVTLTNGAASVSHIVQEVAVTEVDKIVDTISGTAKIGTEVIAWVHGFDQTEMRFTISDGTWLADYAGSFDLVEGMCGRAEIRDETGNSTAVDWCIPNPRFTIFPDGDWYDGWDWPDGATVDITVEGKSECTTSGESWGFFFNGGFPEGCDVVIGDTVTFTDEVTTRTHTVQNLGFSDVDKIENIVAGVADEGALVYVWAHGLEGGFELPVGAEGTWQADFDDIGIDLVENMGGRAEIRDEIGNSTAVDWWIPNPRFIIFPEWNWYDGLDWPDGSAVEITVEGKPECIPQKSEIVDNFFNGGFPEDCDIVIGDKLIFTDGVTTRTHTVQNLAISGVDASWNTVSGTADAYTQLYVWAYDFGEHPVQPSADGEGSWTADFETEGIDLLPGMAGRAEIYDEIGNATSVEWIVPVTILVTNTDDMLANDGVCTLREAIIAANTNTPSGDLEGECPAGIDYGTDIIVLAADQTYPLTIDSTYEDGSFDGDLDFWNNSAPLDLIITVDGDGPAVISQDAAVDDRVMENLWAAVMLHNLILTGGNVFGEGGGILNHGELTIDSVVVDSNISAWGGGGISNTDFAWMTAISSTISNNTAPWGGGIQVIGSTLNMEATTISGNTADNDAGGIFIRNFDAGGTITPVNSTVTITNGSQINGNSAAWGGGISSWGSTLTIDASVVSGNSVTNSGGGILIHDGGFASIMNGSLISENAANWGAGISNWDAELTILDSVISANNAVYIGGGLENGGTLAAINTAFLENTAGGDGDAVWSFTETPYATSVTYSCITGNGSTAVYTVVPVFQDFTFNWWSDPSGPGGVGPGLGDTVGDFIDFSDWLSAPPSICMP